jgi:GDP-fucose transporter C1
MLLGALSAAMVALHAVLIRSALRHVEGRTLDLAYWQNTLGAIALIPAVFYEAPRMMQADVSSFLTGSAVTVS